MDWHSASPPLPVPVIMPVRFSERHGLGPAFEVGDVLGADGQRVGCPRFGDPELAGEDSPGFRAFLAVFDVDRAANDNHQLTEIVVPLRNSEARSNSAASPFKGRLDLR